MEEMMLAVLTAVGVSELLGFRRWAAQEIRKRLDRRRVHRWLCSNTRDEPGESHAHTMDIAKGTGLSEDRVRQACFNAKRILRPRNRNDLWSVWREEPQSVYEKRGLLIV